MKQQTARSIAWLVLDRVERDRAFAELVLHAALRDADLPRRDRAFATELAYGTLRQRGRVDAALAQVLDRSLDRLEARVLNLLRLSVYQILCVPGVPAASAVDESVKLAHDGGLTRAAGFINAVLRTLVSKHADGALAWPRLADDPLAYLEQQGSLPSWLAERWLEQYGAEEAATLAEACVAAPPRSIRVAASADREAIAAKLGGRVSALAPQGITDLRQDPVRGEGFDRGEYTIQDEASQLVPLLLDAQPGETVIDCCAAPGSKTVQIAEAVGPRGEVIALEMHASRIPLILRGARRMGVRNVRALERDASKSFDLQGRLSYPRILVDAPCSGLGTLRRNPDARWNLRPKDIPRAAAGALAILESAARYLSEDGGVLVYSVCTTTPEETVGVVKRFLDGHADFAIDDPRAFLPPAAAKLVDESGALVTLPHRDRCDGFYVVRLVRSA